MFNGKKRLTFGTKLGYGFGDVGGNLFFTVTGIFLVNYFTDILKISPFIAGMIYMIGRIWDAVTDPTIGFLSDRTKTKLGRRRPWILAGSVPLGIFMFLMFMHPGFKSQALIILYAIIIYVLLCTFYTFVNIPYNALTPDLTKDFNEKTELNGYRMIFAVVGTFLGGVISSLLKYKVEELLGSAVMGYIVIGGIMGIILIIAAIIPVITVKEPPFVKTLKSNENIFKLYITAFKNFPFILILIPWALNITGITVITSTLIYYCKYVLIDEGFLPIAFFVLLLFSGISIPISVLISKKIGKKKIYLIGMSIFALAVLLIFLFGHMYGNIILLVFIALAGVGLSSHYVMPWSIIPDTIEYNYAKYGIRKEGIFYGLWTFMVKVGQGVAAGILGVVLALFNYIPNVAQSDTALLGIRLLVGPFTAIFVIAANIVLYFYPITRKDYDRIQKIINLKDRKLPDESS